jgi:hypothetical protein
MIDFRIADPRANSCFASRRFPVIYGSTTRPPGVKFSNDFSRVCMCVCVGHGSYMNSRSATTCDDVKQRNAGLFEVLIGQLADDREIDIVVRKC